MERKVSDRKIITRRMMLGKILSIIQLIGSIFFLATLFLTNLLPTSILLVVVALLIILFILTRLLMRQRRIQDDDRGFVDDDGIFSEDFGRRQHSSKTGRFVVGVILSIIISAIIMVAPAYLMKATTTLSQISNVEYETTTVGVYVLEDDPAQTIADAKDYTFGYAEKINIDETQSSIEQINNDVKQDIVTDVYDSTQDVAAHLLSGDCQAIIMTESFVEMIGDSEEYEDFDEQVRLIATYDYKTKVEKTKKDTPSDIFTMYISGIDAYGGISTKSRSDVNILATVNTNTGEVLLVTTPRDYYVPLSISNGEKDKLTHAGIYGIDVSMDTMEMLYDTKIDYYFRVNFSGFENLIDALGGVDVYSDYTFTAESGDSFTEGMNHMNGEQALAFARERHAFAEGDRQRGKDQMKVIAAVIDKMQTAAVLRDFNGLMDGLEGSFETDMPYSVMSEIVKKQLSNGTSYHTSSYSVDGTGMRATTYSMNQSLYVMEPDMATVEEAKALMEAVKNGETLDIDRDNDE